MIKIIGTHKEVDMMIKVVNDTFDDYGHACNKDIEEYVACEDCIMEMIGNYCGISDRHFIIIYTDDMEEKE
jgi:hypothetical protein